MRFFELTFVAFKSHRVSLGREFVFFSSRVFTFMVPEQIYIKLSRNKLPWITLIELKKLCMEWCCRQSKTLNTVERLLSLTANIQPECNLIYFDLLWLDDLPGNIALMDFQTMKFLLGFFFILFHSRVYICYHVILHLEHRSSFQFHSGELSERNAGKKKQQKKKITGSKKLYYYFYNAQANRWRWKDNRPVHNFMNLYQPKSFTSSPSHSLE